MSGTWTYPKLLPATAEDLRDVLAADWSGPPFPALLAEGAAHNAAVRGRDAPAAAGVRRASATPGPAPGLAP